MANGKTVWIGLVHPYGEDEITYTQVASATREGCEAKMRAIVMDWLYAGFEEEDGEKEETAELQETRPLYAFEDEFLLWIEETTLD